VLDIALLGVSRLPRDEIRKPTRCVASEQRSLRPAQHLDTLHVEQREGETGHLADIDFVDINRRRTFLVVGKVILRDSADGEGERRGPVGLRHDDGRHGLRDIGGRDRSERLQIAA
jgi:hypothetical protein